MENTNIKKHFNDALYWATSTKTKVKGQEKDYHLSRTQEAVLRKLIHYSSSNERITYSNSTIAEHTFIGEDSLKKAIPALNKKGYISTASIRINDGGEFTTRRTIFIKWEKLEFVLSEIPKPEKELDDEAPKPNEQEDVQANQIEEVQPMETLEDVPSKDASQELETPDKLKEQKETNSKEEIPEVVITDEKLRWARHKHPKAKLTSNDLEEFSQENLRLLFYGGGFWSKDENNKENQYLINLFHAGGSNCKLTNLNHKKDFIRLNINDLNHFLDGRGYDFGDVTQELYSLIKLNGVPKRPKDY